MRKPPYFPAAPDAGSYNQILTDAERAWALCPSARSHRPTVERLCGLRIEPVIMDGLGGFHLARDTPDPTTGRLALIAPIRFDGRIIGLTALDLETGAASFWRGPAAIERGPLQ